MELILSDSLITTSASCVQVNVTTIVSSYLFLHLFYAIIVRIMYWSLHDNNILCSFVGHTDTIISLDLNPLNSTFVSTAKDQTTRVWEYGDGQKR